jgi:hypothetical protein
MGPGEELGRPPGFAKRRKVCRFPVPVGGEVRHVAALAVGWHQVETGLRTSVALEPMPGEPADFTIVNWARWDVSPCVMPGITVVEAQFLEVCDGKS